MKPSELAKEIAVNSDINLENKEKGLCIQCGEPALPKCYSLDGRKEFFMSGMCEPCFDGLFDE